MPKRKVKVKNTKVSKKETKVKKVSKRKVVEARNNNDFINSLSSQLRLKESYASLFLGIVVVVVAIALGGILLRGKGYVSNPNLKTSASPMASSPSTMGVNARTYVVQEGEGLYEIAQKIYGNGDLWTKIAEANNISNPDYVEPGTKLVIPEVK